MDRRSSFARRTAEGGCPHMGCSVTNIERRCSLGTTISVPNRNQRLGATLLKLSAPAEFPDRLNIQGSLLGSGVPCRVKPALRTGYQTRCLKTDLQTTPNSLTASWPGWLPLLVVPASTILFRNRVPAWVFMWALSFAIFAGLKWMTWWKAATRVAHSTGRSLAYLVAWPGMDADAFLDPDRHPIKPTAQAWLWAILKTVLGVALLWVVARRIPEPQVLLRGWTGLFGLIFLLHFGSFHLLALFWQAMGVDAEPIMSEPILAKTLSEFWGRRWNLGFRQLAHDLIFRPLHKCAGVAAAGLLVFVASGLIHDLVISLPAGGGYGLPTGYFILQGLGVTLERSASGRRLGLQKGRTAWIFMVIVTAAPAFWLFHPPFVLRVIIPFMHAIHAL
jgi:hypothetical protein